MSPEVCLDGVVGVEEFPCVPFMPGANQAVVADQLGSSQDKVLVHEVDDLSRQNSTRQPRT